MPFARNSEIYGENEPAEYLYKVISGTVRTYKVLVDGRRQIGAFHAPGDVFGFESGEEHTFSAEAITDCKIMRLRDLKAGNIWFPTSAFPDRMGVAES
jgi:CRP/FNR family nitrogen fixation transcriptional regulator